MQTQQQIALQGQQVAQTAEGQTIVYQPVNADGTILQQGMTTIPTANWQEHRLFIQKPTPTQPAVGKGLSL